MLLRFREELQIWLEERPAESDDLMKKQGFAVLEWLVPAIKLAYRSQELKAKVRKLLLKQRFTPRLNFFWSSKEKIGAFDKLRKELETHMSALGKELLSYHTKHNLKLMTRGHTLIYLWWLH